MHAKLLISHRCLSVCWVTAPYGRVWRKGFEMTAERETEKPDSVNTSPFGILESGGSQHSMWKPRSHESQNSISSWKETAGMFEGRRCCIRLTPPPHPSFKIFFLHKRGFNKSEGKPTNPQGCTKWHLPQHKPTTLKMVVIRCMHCHTYSILPLYSTGAAGFAFNTLPS